MTARLATGPMIASVAVIVSLALSSCGGESWIPRRVQSYSFFNDRLVVEGHCNTDGRVIVVNENDDEVRIRLEVTGPRKGDCLECPTVPITSDLGDRRLADATNGRVIARNDIAC